MLGQGRHMVIIQTTWLAQCAFIQILHLCLLRRGPASDQPDDEGAFRGSVRVAGEAAGGAGLPGDQAGGGPGPHGGADHSEPGAEQEDGAGGADWGRLDGEGVTLILCFLFICYLLGQSSLEPCPYDNI